jgi:hypothetical protein
MQKILLSVIMMASAGAAAPALYGMWSANIGHAHPPEVQPQHQLGKIDPKTGTVTKIGIPTVGGALGQQTGEVWNYKGDQAMFTLNNLYDGAKINVRIEKHSLDDGKLMGIYPLPEVPFVQWTSFGQQMVVQERDTGLFVTVLAPTAHLGGYNFNFSLYTLNLAENKTSLEADLGVYTVTPEESAGYSVTHDGHGILYTQLGDAQSGKKVLLEIACQGGKVLRKIEKPPVNLNLVLGADGDKGLYAVSAGYIIPAPPPAPGSFVPGVLSLWKLEPNADHFTLVSTFDELGSQFELNPPAISALLSSDSSDQGALAVAAVDLTDKFNHTAINTVSLITLPLAGNSSKMKASVANNFCHMKIPGKNYTCPKVISALKQKNEVIV